MDIKKIIMAGYKANVASLEYQGLKVVYKTDEPKLETSNFHNSFPASEAIESNEEPRQASFDENLMLTDPIAYEKSLFTEE